MKSLQNFTPQRKFLLCVDSDGCAMDTMDIKHKTCFGPKMIECYGLTAKREAVGELWDNINLYSKTRGINRFLGLVETLKAVESNGIAKLSMPYDSLEAWTGMAKELSNPALAAEVSRTGDPQLALALSWSKEVNNAISKLQSDHGAFCGVKEALSKLSNIADIAVVSSANSEALVSEWERCGLVPYINVLLGQEVGSKAFCISELVRMGGYDPGCVLMVGDAVGDLKSAEKNGVFFYPILVGWEEFSWERLCSEAIDVLTSGTFEGEYQERLKREFFDNFK